jgi:hypothetical protein
MTRDPVTIRLSLQFGEGDIVVIHLAGRSRPVVARALGVDRDDSGEIRRVFLDRKIHRPGQTYAGAWAMSGAISTIVERQFCDSKPH